MLMEEHIPLHNLLLDIPLQLCVSKKKPFLFCKPLLTSASQTQSTWKIFLALEAKLQLVML